MTDAVNALGWLTINAFTASDKVLVVVEPGYFELDSISQLSLTLEEVQEYFHPNLELMGILFTKADSTINSRTSLDILRKKYKEKVFDTIIPRAVALKTSSFKKKDIFSSEPKSKGALAYQRLIKEIFHV